MSNFNNTDKEKNLFNEDEKKKLFNLIWSEKGCYRKLFFAPNDAAASHIYVLPSYISKEELHLYKLVLRQFIEFVFDNGGVLFYRFDRKDSSVLSGFFIREGHCYSIDPDTLKKLNESDCLDFLFLEEEELATNWQLRGMESLNNIDNQNRKNEVKRNA